MPPYAISKIAPIRFGPTSTKNRRVEILAKPGFPFGVFAFPAHAGDVDSQNVVAAVHAASIPTDTPAAIAEEHFGDLLQMLNRQFLTRKGAIQGAIGMIAESTLLLARIGTPHVFLWRKGPEGNYQRFRLWKDEETETRLFSHILTGTVQDGDTLLISFGFSERAYATEFDRVIPALPPEGAAAALAERLWSGKEKQSGTAFEGVIVKCTLHESTSALPVTNEASPAKSRELQRAAKPSLFGEDFPLVQLLRAASIALKNSRRGRRGDSKAVSAIGTLLRSVLRLILALVTLAAATSTLLFVVSTNWRGSRTRLAERIRERLRERGRAFETMPGRSKAFLVLGIAFGLLFLRGIVSLAAARVHEADAANFRGAVAEIEGKRDAIEATLIYGDEKRAKEIFDESEALLAKLPRRSAAQRKAAEALGETLNASRERLRRAVRIPDPTVVAVLPAEKEYRGLITLGGTLYSWTPDGQIFAANPQSGKTGAMLTALDEPGPTNLGALDEDGIIFWNGRKLTRWAKGERVATALEFTPAGNSPIRAIALWNRRLYVLDEAGNIWRHDRSPAGFGKGVPWLKNTPPLAGTVAMAIDGSLWGAKENGEVVKIFAGLPQAFAAGEAIPPLRQASALATDADAQYLYLIDPAERRLLVYGKDGKFIIQYVSDQFDSLSAVTVSEKTKTLYLLNKNVLYGIIATHLQK
ncbi:MAG: hypothetical protein AAB562_00180 [Patescibacteria group bacterium]